MARSPSDATRFTSTGPHISNKPSSPGATSFLSNATSTATSGTQLNFDTSIPSSETAQQKIARLRAAAALAKRGHETGFDKTVRIGRIWADRAHRVTAFSLIGLTVISGAVATAGITDMLMHNRRRRNEWLAEKQAETARELAIARQAEAFGTATEDQMLLINRERAADEAALAKKSRPGLFKRTTSWLYDGLSQEEQKGGRLGASSLAGDAAPQQPSPASSTLRAVEDGRRQGEAFEEILRPAGGPLDQQAQLMADVTVRAGKSWTSWITGR